jgi:iron complex outermembrane receptor protein
MQQSATEIGQHGAAPSLNVFHPDYHMVIPTPGPWVNYLTDPHQAGAYGQDEIHWDRLILTGSLRHDWPRSKQTDRQWAAATTRQSPGQITWRASGLYHFDFGLAPYISYSTSFQPQSGLVSADGGRIAHQASPSVGKQLEGGLKYQLPGTSLLPTAAGFHIEQTNVLVSVANAAGWSRAA